MQRSRFLQYIQDQLRMRITVNRNWALCVTSLLLLHSPVQGYGQERWFQIEVSIFSNESINGRSEETWLPGASELGFPDGLSRLKQLNDILLTEELILASTD